MEDRLTLYRSSLDENIGRKFNNNKVNLTPPQIPPLVFALGPAVLTRVAFDRCGLYLRGRFLGRIKLDDQMITADDQWRLTTRWVPF